MTDLRKRLLRRSIIVVLALGALGFLFAQVFLKFIASYSSNPDPANERVLWQTPLVMAGMGLALTLLMELASFALRKKPQPAPLPPQPTTGELLSRIMEENERKK